MKKLIFPAFLFFSSLCFAQSPATRWDIQKDTAGNYIVTSFTQRVFKTNAEASQFLASEMDPKQAEIAELNRLLRLVLNEKPKEQPVNKH